MSRWTKATRNRSAGSWPIAGASSSASCSSSPPRSRWSPRSVRSFCRCPMKASSASSCAAPVGQRVEKTEQQVAEVERVLRAQIPADELETIVSSTGVLAQGRSSLFNPNTGPHTSVISVHLVSPDKRTRNQVQIMNDVRPKVLKLFPGVAMFFDPGGLVKRVTSFGSQKSVDVEIYGYDFEKAREVIRQVESMMHQDTGPGRHRSQPRGELSRGQRGGGSREGRPPWHQRNGRRQRRALFTQRQRPDRPHHLHRPSKRERILHQRLARGRTPERPHRHREHHFDRDEPESRSCSRTSRRSSSMPAR